MAGRGPAPKPQRVRPTDDKRRQGEFTILTPDGEVRGPELPDLIDWPQPTLDLYEALRRDPAASLFTEVDWINLRDVLLAHAALWADGDVRHLPEIRLRLAAYGVTPEARLRLRWLVQTDAAVESKLDALRRRAEAVNSPSPRSPRGRRLLKAVAETNKTINKEN